MSHGSQLVIDIGELMLYAIYTYKLIDTYFASHHNGSTNFEK